MPVRKTESRIPNNFIPSDLGQAFISSDKSFMVVSYITSPLVICRKNTYVLFVPNSALATLTQVCEWVFQENESEPEIRCTEFGEINYCPKCTGTLSVKVNLLNSCHKPLASIEFRQQISHPNAELENLILCAKKGPIAGNPEVLRELVNDYNIYYQNISLQNGEREDGFKKFVFSLLNDEVLKNTSKLRTRQLNQMAISLNQGRKDEFAKLSSIGVGVCGIRLILLSMTFLVNSSSLIPLLQWTELPMTSAKKAIKIKQLEKQLAEVRESKLIDLFNLVRFPKSNIIQCGRILESIRDRYFGNSNFNGVLTGMSGTRAHWISRHYKEGPLLIE